MKVTLVSAGKHKVEGNPYEPLGDEARTAIQGRVDDYYALIVKAVAKGRGTTPAAVREGFGQGRVVGAADAVELGMADRIGTLDQEIARLVKPRRKAGSAEPSLELARRRQTMLELEI
jgi:ClpP class serine protease